MRRLRAFLLVGFAVATPACSDAVDSAATEDCQPIARTNNETLRRDFLPIFGSSIADVEEASGGFPGGFCDLNEGGPYGGITARWDGITATDAVAMLEGRGWKRHNPAGGEPPWVAGGTPPATGSSIRDLEGTDNFDNDGFQALDAEGKAHNPQSVVFIGELGGRDAEVTVNPAGMRVLIY